MSSKIPKTEIAQEMDRLHRGLIQEGVMRSCINCEHWSTKGNNFVCSLANKTPPPETLVFGCESWNFNIPF